ncbi:MAG TPA: lipase family protein, partial [Casimicrobiaceae bacterium]|nr:lipase family protein [Casimicrobiaceae bacterium]
RPKPRAERDMRFVLHPAADDAYVHYEASEANPFEPAAARVSRVNAWWLAEAALLSYWPPDIAIARFRAAGMESLFIEQRGVQCYISVASAFVIVSFRGTEVDDLQDVFDDARFALVRWNDAGAKVHHGFREAFERIEPRLADALASIGSERTLWFSGHSLGGALAALAGDRFGRTSGILTIGSPRVGNTAFATAFDDRFGAVTVRYVSNRDLVTRVPPRRPFGYEHVGELRHIDANGSIGGALPAPLALADRIRDLTRTQDALLDHMPRGYSIDIWNDYAGNGG